MPRTSKTRRVKTVDKMAKNIQCLRCGENYSYEHYYSSNSKYYEAMGKIPYCRDCLEEMFLDYRDSYEIDGFVDPNKKAMERLCMALDIYYSDKVYDGALKKTGFSKNDSSITGLYFKQVNLNQYRRKDYDTTIQEKSNLGFSLAKDVKEAADFSMGILSEKDVDTSNIVEKASKFFGKGFSSDDYLFLQEQYDDWTTRHECESKSQEEMFKQLCFTQLQLLKAQRKNEDTKDLNTTFMKQLDVANLQPKQNYSETTSKAQTFGTLIDKWENTRPIPDIDEDLKDVDKIGLYIDVFFRGHLAKMMGLKNGLSNLYTKFMKKYTVEKPEYEDDTEGEALFDAIFGSVDLDDM